MSYIEQAVALFPIQCSLLCDALYGAGCSLMPYTVKVVM